MKLLIAIAVLGLTTLALMSDTKINAQETVSCSGGSAARSSLVSVIRARRIAPVRSIIQRVTTRSRTTCGG